MRFPAQAIEPRSWFFWLMGIVLLGGCPSTEEPRILTPHQAGQIAQETASKYLGRTSFPQDELRAMKRYLVQGKARFLENGAPLDLELIHEEFVQPLPKRWQPLLSEVAWALIQRRLHLPRLIEKGETKKARAFLVATTDGVLAAIDHQLRGAS